MLAASTLAAAIVATGPVRAPSIPDGVADVNGTVGVVENPAGGIDAVALATGKRLWTSSDGRWPLCVAQDRVVVALPEPQRPNALRLRFLRVADGKRAGEAKPVVFPAWVAVAPPPLDARAPSFAVAARASCSELHWEAHKVPVYGFAAPDPAAGQHAAGTLLVDHATATVREAAATPPPALPALPAGFAPDRGLMYWGWSDWGSAWSTKPRAFGIAATSVFGLIAVETGGQHRLLVHRWRGPETLAPLAVAGASAEYYPIVTRSGGHLIVLARNGPSEVITLHDLSDGGKALARLPPFEPGFRTDMALIGPLLTYVVENTTAAASGGARTDRTLVALEWATGRVRWRYPLSPRFLAPPVPGGGLPR